MSTSERLYSKAKRALVFADWPFSDSIASLADRGNSSRTSCPTKLTTITVGGKYDTEVDPKTVPAGSRLLERDGRPVGFINDRLLVFPCASADESTDKAWLHRLYLDAANRWKLPGATSPDEAGEIFRSDTGELVLGRRRGVFTAAAPNAVIAAGFVGSAGTLALGSVSINCQTPFASISLVSLDGKPLGQSARLLLTAVARSENTGQAYLADASRPPSAPEAIDADTGAVLGKRQSSLTEHGRPPVLAEPVDAEIRLVSKQPLKAFSLTPRGQRQHELSVSQAEGSVVVPTKNARSPWVLLTAD